MESHQGMTFSADKRLCHTYVSRPSCEKNFSDSGVRVQLWLQMRNCPHKIKPSPDVKPDIVRGHRDTDSTDAQTQVGAWRDGASKSSIGQVKLWDVVKGGEWLCNGQKWGGQSHGVRLKWCATAADAEIGLRLMVVMTFSCPRLLAGR